MFFIFLQYELTVAGLDGVNEAETNVIINIRDVNDLPPQFLEQSYQTTVFEETEHVRRPILKVSHGERHFNGSAQGQAAMFVLVS